VTTDPEDLGCASIGGVAEGRDQGAGAALKA